MNPIFNWLLEPYENTPLHLIILEIIGVVFGFLSVLFSKKDNILVFPTGLISTAVFVYILSVYSLLGDMMINGYYFIMSVYGWYMWTRKVDTAHYIPIQKATRKEHHISLLIFLGTVAFVIMVYSLFEKWNSWTASVDTITTGLFFVGMWLMAKKKVENWVYWIFGDLISIPLYFYKGLGLTALQYILFTIIAYYGYKAWLKQTNIAKTDLLK